MIDSAFHLHFFVHLVFIPELRVLFIFRFVLSRTFLSTCLYILLLLILLRQILLFYLFYWFYHTKNKFEVEVWGLEVLGQGVWVEDIREVLSSKGVEGFVGENEYFAADVELWKPVKVDEGVEVICCQGLEYVGDLFWTYWSLPRSMLGNPDRTPLQYPKREVINAWVTISATKSEREGSCCFQIKEGGFDRFEKESPGRQL